MSRNAAFRLIAFGVFLAALKISGLVAFDLPWGDASFQIAGVTVLLYLAWSIAGSRRTNPAGTISLESFGPYAVLLVSAVDGLLLRLTPIPVDPFFRWIGPVMFAAGAVAGMACGPRPGRWTGALRLFGLAIGFSSMAGMVVAVPAFIASRGSGSDDAPVVQSEEDGIEGPGSEG